MKKNTPNQTSFNSEGSGKPLIFIHGLGMNKKMWKLQVPAFISNYHVITYDLLGHGLTNFQSEIYSIDKFVEQLNNFVKYLGIKEFGLIGFSLGGIIARAYAAHYSDSIKALSIISSPYQRSKKERKKVMLRAHESEEGGPVATVDDAIERWFTNDFILSKHKIISQVRNWVLSNNPKIYHKIYKVFASADIDHVNYISSIKCPTLIIACEEDVGNSPNMAKKMAKNISSAKLEVVPGLKHMGLLEKPKLINKILLDFFNYSYHK